MRRLRMLFLVLALGLLASGARAEDLAQGFQSPPDSAKPHTWWHWMNGNITKEGITADLEAMKQAGVGGAQIFNVDCGIPAGSVKIMTPEWREMMKHAISEANRLGIEICVHNCPGWSSSGGPWNTPEHAMQKIVTTEQQASGPGAVTVKLPQPQTNAGYYEDLVVLAFRNPDGAADAMKAAAPKISASDPACKAAQALDGKDQTEATLPLPSRRKPQYLQLEFAQPFQAQTLTVNVGRGISELTMAVQASEDGKKFRTLRSFGKSRKSAAKLVVSLGNEPVSARYFRLTLSRVGAKDKRVAIAELNLSPAVKIENLEGKLANTGAGSVRGFDTPAIPAGQAIDPKATIDLTGKMGKDGQLTWEAPEGEWTILRVGHTFTGKNNHPAPAEGTGPEVDKMSAEAFDAHWAGMMQKIIDDVGPLAGQSLNNSLIDSYEVNGQNWTPKMREEFKKRRGYDMFEFLPVFTGRIVRSSEETERFLWDLRRTVSDLIAENYYGRFAELCHKNHLNASIEPYTGPFESLQAGAYADIPMGEFWSGSQGHSSVKIAANTAHLYGRKFVGAESFTASPEPGRWQNDPWSFKALGDKIYTQGVNRYIFHRYAMQPWLNVYPGMTMGQWGFHFERTNGWWDEGTAWLKYCARSQYLLQSGRFVADAAYFMSEDAPNEIMMRENLKPALPAGNDYDCVGFDVLMKGAKVENGRLVLASGMSYRVLVLPEGKRMRPETLAKIKELAEAGLTVVGPRPNQSPSFQNYPQCDQELKALADAMWGTDNTKSGERAIGQGKVVWGKPLEEVFAGLGVKPDFEATAPADAKMLYIHRTADGTEIYFVSNQRLAAQDATCIFRASGLVPELWHPDTGKMETAPVWSEANGRVTLPIHFDPAGSVFVVFRQKADGADHAAELQVAAAPEEKLAAQQPKLVIVKAVYEAVDGAGSLDVTAKVAELVDAGKTTIEATNEMAGKDPANLHVKRLRVEYTQDGKAKSATAQEHESLELPGNGGALSAFPVCTLAAEGGKLVATAWRPATVSVKTAAGKTLSAEVKALPKPLEVGGAWAVAFPKGWGAPEQATFEKLISWSDSPEQGIKYFSGTATYTKKLEIPAELIGEGKTLALDLGDVKNLAQVSLNGQDLGILWKYPYRVDISKVAKAGENTLEVKVTNMWCNRLIGDEQLPSDVEWNNDKSLKGWPTWLPEYLKTGKRPSSGRFTFTTWHHFTKDSPLYPAGLLGPVVVRAAAQVEVK